MEPTKQFFKFCARKIGYALREINTDKLILMNTKVRKFKGELQG